MFWFIIAIICLGLSVGGYYATHSNHSQHPGTSDQISSGLNQDLTDEEIEYDYLQREEAERAAEDEWWEEELEEEEEED